MVAAVLLPLLAIKNARLGPVAGGALSSPVDVRSCIVVADVGAGAGGITLPLARAASAAQAQAPGSGLLRPTLIVASEPQAWLREELLMRCVSSGVKNVLVMKGGGEERAGITASRWADAVSLGLVAPPSRTGSAADDEARLGIRAHILLLANVLHHVPPGSRASFLSRTVQEDMVQGGHVVIVEFKSVDEGGPVEGPPNAMRLERSSILIDAGCAGLQLVDCPTVTQSQHVMVFSVQ